MNKGIRFFLLILSCLSLPPDLLAETHTFSGGPEGGTYQHYAKGIADLSGKAGIKIKAAPSGGSLVNIRLVNSGKSGFGVAYSGDLFKAGKGMLPRDGKTYADALAMGYFYSAAAQLVVRADAGIASPSQLAGKNMAVGNFGSGAASSCELFFRELGVWHKIRKKFLGYAEAAEAFGKGELDAFWVFAGCPNAAVKKAARKNRISLVETYGVAEEKGILKKYPYFSEYSIPANTYEGVSAPTLTIGDAAIWIAHAQVPADTVYKLLGLVYSYEGIRHMLGVHPSAKAMSVQGGISGIVTPLHPGAERFWKEKGLVR